MLCKNTLNTVKEKIALLMNEYCVHNIYPFTRYVKSPLSGVCQFHAMDENCVHLV